MKENYEYKCDNCKNVISGKKAYYIIKHIENKQTKTGYCNKECRQQAFNSKEIEVKCFQCNNSFKRRPSQIRTNSVFCSVKCKNDNTTVYLICKGCSSSYKKHTRKNPIYCNINCQRKCEYENYIQDWKEGNNKGSKGPENVSSHIRKYLFLKNGNKCSKCGWCEVSEFTKKIPLQVDHIDGNWKDNSEKNLQLLCPNCHSLTPTYGSLNKGNGREYRKKWKNGLVGNKYK